MSWNAPTIELVEGTNFYLTYNNHRIRICGLRDGGGIRILPLNGGIKDRPRAAPLGQFQVRLTGPDGSPRGFDERKVTTCLEIEPLGLRWNADKKRCE